MATYYKTSSGKFLVYNNKLMVKAEAQVLASVRVQSGGSFDLPNGDTLNIGAYTEGEINFWLDSGDPTCGFYEWNGNIQQTGYGQIYDYSDLYDYDGSELRVYLVDPYEISYNPTDAGCIQQGFRPYVIRLNNTNGTWDFYGQL